MQSATRNYCVIQAFSWICNASGLMPFSGCQALSESGHGKISAFRAQQASIVAEKGIRYSTITGAMMAVHPTQRANQPASRFGTTANDQGFDRCFPAVGFTPHRKKRWGSRVPRDTSATNDGKMRR